MDRDLTKDETWMDVRTLRRRMNAKQISEDELAEHLKGLEDCGHEAEVSTARMQYTGNGRR